MTDLIASTVQPPSPLLSRLLQAKREIDSGWNMRAFHLLTEGIELLSGDAPRLATLLPEELAHELQAAEAYVRVLQGKQTRQRIEALMQDVLLTGIPLSTAAWRRMLRPGRTLVCVCRQLPFVAPVFPPYQPIMVAALKRTHVTFHAPHNQEGVLFQPWLTRQNGITLEQIERGFIVVHPTLGRLVYHFEAA
ncbi:hypothetical protein [Deinococcus ruber]|uniref:Uncharacterized protein n=1 Tax=Deinococcus ruber TaxID=1848197 RepID=A0A918C9W9_9DEIO|nr:hypothetical protein [Deinococcus ruber]GGR13187.1 hypothetical protein GCM10008957_27680 [Deinococcus ruber]